MRGQGNHEKINQWFFFIKDGLMWNNVAMSGWMYGRYSKGGSPNLGLYKFQFETNRKGEINII